MSVPGVGVSGPAPSEAVSTSLLIVLSFFNFKRRLLSQKRGSTNVDVWEAEPPCHVCEVL